MIFEGPPAVAGRLLLAIVIALGTPLAAVAAGDDTPAYPGSKPEAISHNVHATTATCGHTIAVVKSLSVDADPHKIATWYQGKLPGSRAIDIDKLAGDDSSGGMAHMTQLEVVAGDGAHVVVINRMTFASAQAKSAGAMIGMDKATIGIESISPPFGPGYAALVAQAASGGSASVQAKQQIAAACKH